MNRIVHVVCLLATVTLIAAESFAAPPQVPPGFRALFNGRDIEDWWGMSMESPESWIKLEGKKAEFTYSRSMKEILPFWTIEQGELVNDGEGYYLTTKEFFADFELRLEVQVGPGTNSGVLLRGMPEVQLWDTTGTGRGRAEDRAKGSGGLAKNMRGTPGRDPLLSADRPLGEWNEVRIVMVGERVTVDLNGERVVAHARLDNYFDRTKPLPHRGPIALQAEGGSTRWRNIVIREIGPDEANRYLGDHDAAGFEPIFDGNDLDGWTGAVDGYEVVDGAIRCRPGHGGVLFTEDRYADFTVRLEINIPPGGNNGLAIRYPGEGDAAYAGMCELQVLDNDAPQYAKLDPRQYHGSAYGQAAAARGCLRPAGEWNFQEVTVSGSRITVELNGMQILDADLSKLTELMYPIERFPGRDRSEGHFGFAGHNDPVEFRNIRVKPRMAAPPER